MHGRRRSPLASRFRRRRARRPSRNVGLSRLEVLAERGERAAQQPRQVRLRDTELIGDLLLGAVLDEAEMDDLPITLVEAGEQLRHVELRLELVHVAVGAREHRSLGDRSVADGGVEAVGPERRPRCQRLQHTIGRFLQPLGQVGDPGRSPELLGELGFQPPGLHGQLLEAPWRTDRPALVAQQSLQLALDGAVGERLERHADLGVEALDRLDEGHERLLADVVGFDLALAVPAHVVLDEVEVLLDQGVAQPAGRRWPGSRRNRSRTSASIDRRRPRGGQFEDALVAVAAQ